MNSITITLVATALAASSAAQQAIDLGGGCITPQLLSWGVTNTMSWQTQPAPFGATTNYIAPTQAQFPWPSTFTPGYLIVLGFSDPNAVLPSCGCVVHTSAEVVAFGGFQLPPPSPGGHTIYAQGVWFEVGGLPLTGGCTEEPTLHPVLTNGYRLLIP